VSPQGLSRPLHPTRARLLLPRMVRFCCSTYVSITKVQGTSLTRRNYRFPHCCLHARTHTHQMLEDHVIGRDMCIIGPKGSGKSTLVKCVAHCSLSF